MALKKKKKNDVIIGLHRGGREVQAIRNGGLQFVAVDRPWKNKKKYNRKRDRRINFDCLFQFRYNLGLIRHP